MWYGIYQNGIFLLYHYGILLSRGDGNVSTERIAREPWNFPGTACHRTRPEPEFHPPAATKAAPAKPTTKRCSRLRTISMYLWITSLAERTAPISTDELMAPTAALLLFLLYYLNSLCFWRFRENSRQIIILTRNETKPEKVRIVERFAEKMREIIVYLKYIPKKP